MITESGIIISIKALAVPVLGAILGAVGWMAKKLHNRVDDLEKHYSRLDKQQAVQEAQLTEIKQDIHNIDKKLDKIIDKIFSPEGHYGRRFKD